MSWSFYYKGPGLEAASKAREAQKTGIQGQPEESFRQNALEHIANVSESYSEKYHVDIVAHGSQYRDDSGPLYNDVKIDIRHFDPVTEQGADRTHG